ncbi:SMI1/KNR4 family protein [Algibacter lectus]|uniref:SMI1/KNR4 family protein SUKH-1 n=1 Tax=Algibacter lectus TaxID=221126 RepID=A0A4R8ME84_9FLAO|nr:SMI1/KNR4 family protein [Algibacter lectus]MWW26914.1 SMI1/KNR4 family protein [Algibacter lectus]TDY64203.1 SMI1/KNR4 family protein SUKH-1 [Algibacter lectus]
MANLFFTNTALKMHILNNGVTKEKIENVISQDFKGKEDFIKFYLAYDGVFFNEGAVVSIEQFEKDDEDEYYELELESIYRIDQIQSIWEAIKERSAGAKKFMESHIPFAGDAGGNDFFIEIPTGTIKYISWEYEIEEGLIGVAHNFKDFCLSVEPLN